MQVIELWFAEQRPRCEDGLSVKLILWLLLELYRSPDWSYLKAYQLDAHGLKRREWSKGDPVDISK